MLIKINDSSHIYQGDCLDILAELEPESIDMVFADPPYKLSNGGITCKSGRMASVDKGDWDKSQGLHEDYAFNKEWLRLLKRVLKPTASLWVSGTYHAIYPIAFAMMESGYVIINDISWYKPNAAPNISCRCFTASHETLIWAKKDKKAKHLFNYQVMKELNGGKQMRSVWTIPTPPPSEKTFGKHPTQKPIALLSNCILASSNPGDVILDPFCGSGTTGVAALRLDRRFVGIEIDETFVDLSIKRIKSESESRGLF